MKLGVGDLNAFRIAARERSITVAARLLHTSQSSLSRRLRLLEDKLQVCLLLRGNQGVELTESGRKLLRHIDTLCLHEEELIAELRGLHPHGLHGLLRVAAGSAMLDSVVIPAIAPLLRANPGTLVEFTSAEGLRLDRLLQDGGVDVMVSGPPAVRRGVNSLCIGTEVHYVFESALLRERDDTWLELSHADDAMERFFAASLPPSHRRCTVANAHALATSVEAGLGRALLPAHFLTPGRSVRRALDFVPCAIERFVHHAREARNARLVRAVVDSLLSTAPALLARDPAGLARLVE